MSGSDLDLSVIRERLVDALGDSVKWHSDFENRPLLLHLRSPLPSKVRLYLYNLVPSGRDEEYKINVRLPGHNGDRAEPDRSGGYLTILGGYNDGHDVFAFWDDDLYEDYGAVSPLQVMAESVEEGAEGGFVTQQRGGGDGGETVIVATSENVKSALLMRDRLVQLRSLLFEYLPDGWRDNSSRAQTIEQVVLEFLENTPTDRSTANRRSMAQETIADEQGVTVETVRDKFRSNLWGDRDPGSGGYQQEYLDPILEEIEAAWRDELRDISEDIEYPDHPLIQYLQENQSDISVYMYSKPVDYWPTVARYNAISFGEDERDLWESVKPGDVVFFYTESSPSNPEISEDSEGIVGASIIGRKYENHEEWWWMEQEQGASLPLRIGFRRVFFYGEIGELDRDLKASISDKPNSIIGDEIDLLTANILDASRANGVCQDIVGESLPDGVPLAEFLDDDDESDILRPTALVSTKAPEPTEAPPVNIESEFSGPIITSALDGLYFPEGSDKILNQIESALNSGKHIILTGPPGTGKTEIAERVVEYLAKNYPWLYNESELTTATADWSTFDTVGGYMPEQKGRSGDSLKFNPGIVLSRFKDRKTGTQLNEPIVIDELNRADIDKAFGQLFTTLSGQTVQLPYSIGDEEIEITATEDLTGLPEPHQFVVPNSWPIFATMNTYDKTSLYEMSYAFMRRFSFIPIDVPKLPSSDDENERESILEMMSGYISVWNGLDIEDHEEEIVAVTRVWRNTNEAVDARSLGPAIVKDILTTITNYPEDAESLENRLTNAIISFIFPQLEGVPERRRIVNGILESPNVDNDRLKDAAVEILQITFEDNG